MEFIINNWQWIAVLIILLCGGIIAAIKLIGLSADERATAVKGWLLQAVLLAEQEFGGGTGKLKLSWVYDKFCERFPWLVKVISFERFSALVDEALDEMKKTLQENGAIAAFVEGGK